MIRVEADDCIVVEAIFLEALHDVTNHIIDHGDHAGGQCHGFLQIAFVRHHRSLRRGRSPFVFANYRAEIALAASGFYASRRAGLHQIRPVNTCPNNDPVG